MPITTKERIVEVYNLSISAIENAHSAAKGNHFNSAIEQISSAAGLIYNTLEWSFKYYLAGTYDDPVIFPVEWRIIEGSNFHKKVDLFERSASPSISTSGVDLSVIKDYKQIVRNDPEHSGIAPHYNSLLKVIGTTRNILEIYLSVSPSQLQDLLSNQPFEISLSDEWLNLLTSAEGFSNEYNYILLTDLSKEQPNIIKPLSLIDWNAILDFDIKSEVSGLHYAISNDLNKRRSIHSYTLNDIIPSSLSQESCYWIFANGLEGRANSSFNEFRFWSSNVSHRASPSYCKKLTGYMCFQFCGSSWWMFEVVYRCMRCNTSCSHVYGLMLCMRQVASNEYTIAALCAAS